MDGIFSSKGKEAMLISGFLGIFIYFLFMEGETDQNKFYYMFLGYGFWLIIKYIYWTTRTHKIIAISKNNLYDGYEEIKKIRKHDEIRANNIENIINNTIKY